MRSSLAVAVLIVIIFGAGAFYFLNKKGTPPEDVSAPTTATTATSTPPSENGQPTSQNAATQSPAPEAPASSTTPPSTSGSNSTTPSTAASNTAPSATTQPTPPSAPSSGTAEPTTAGAAPQVALLPQLAIGPDEHTLGKVDAPVTMIEYGSYTCPHCAHFDQETLPRLKTDFIDKGQVRFVFREFVRNGVDIKAAQLVHCGPPDTFFNFVDVLFRSQETWAFVQDPVDALKKIGRTAGLDSAKIDQCLADEPFATKLVADTKAAYENLKINATPTLVVNGTNYPNIPYEDYDDNGTKQPGLASVIKGMLPKP